MSWWEEGSYYHALKRLQFTASLSHKDWYAALQSLNFSSATACSSTYNLSVHLSCSSAQAKTRCKTIDINIEYIKLARYSLMSLCTSQKRFIIQGIRINDRTTLIPLKSRDDDLDAIWVHRSDIWHCKSDEKQYNQKRKKKGGRHHSRTRQKTE